MHLASRMERMAAPGQVLMTAQTAGVGKSRLVHESVTAVPAGVAVHRLQASPYDISTPYHPLVSLFGGAATDRGRRTAATLRDDVAAAVAAVAPAVGDEVIEPLIAMVGGDPGSRP